MPIRATIKKIKGGVCAPRGFLASAVSAGIKNPDDPRLDLSLIYSKHECSAAGTFTTNRVKAAPVKVSQAYLKADKVQAIVANSGNANACTGVEGISDARKTCNLVAKGLGLRQRQIAVCSTGVIGLPMPMSRIEPKIGELVSGLGPKNGEDVAHSIMTSDTCKKEIAISV